MYKCVNDAVSHNGFTFLLLLLYVKGGVPRNWSIGLSYIKNKTFVKLKKIFDDIKVQKINYRIHLFLVHIVQKIKKFITNVVLNYKKRILKPNLSRMSPKSLSRTISATRGERGLPIATPSIWSYVTPSYWQ